MIFSFQENYKWVEEPCYFLMNIQYIIFEITMMMIFEHFFISFLRYCEIQKLKNFEKKNPYIKYSNDSALDSYH